MRTVHLHGALGEKYGTSFKIDVSTAAEAIRMLAVNFPTLPDDLKEGAWHVVRGDVETGLSLGEEDLLTLRLGRGDLHIMPAIAGSKNGGTLKTIMGVALAGVAIIMSGGALATPILGGSLGGLTYGNMAMFGAVLAASGVSQLLSPQEKTDENKQSSFTLSGPGNAYEQGNPVPLIYGEVITGSVMVSGGVDVEKIAVGA